MANSPFIVSYPSKLRRDGSASGAPPITDYVTFTTIKNIRTRFDNANDARQTLSNYNVSSKYEPFATASNVPAAVSMYMPQKVTENYLQNWNNVNLEYELSKVSRNVGLSPGEAAQKYVEKTGFKTVIEQLGKLSNANLSENAILSATSGIIYNPMAEVLYEGPEFRTFTYNFTLFASSQAEAKNIFRIVQFFRNASVPSFSSSKTSGNLDGLIGLASAILGTEVAAATAVDIGKLLLSRRAAGKTADAAEGGGGGSLSEIFNNLGGSLNGATSLATLLARASDIGGNSRFISQPPLILIQYKRGAELHPYINSPKPCVVRSFDVDFTPSGSYTILNNFGEKEIATVVATNITLTLAETRIVYREDFYNLPEPKEAPPANNVPNAPLTPGSANNPIGNAQLITPP